MSTKPKKGLGKGLDALLGGGGASRGVLEKAPAAKGASSSNTDSSVDVVDNSATQALGSPESVEGSQLVKLDIATLQPGKYQPRQTIDSEALEDLAASIRRQGVMQPIVVRPVPEDCKDPSNPLVRYEIIAGERRWRAVQLAGLTEVPAIVRELSDEAAIAMALIENLQRDDLNPIEEANALHRLQQEFELTHQEVAEAVGKSRTAVSNALRLLNLEAEVRRLLEHGDIEMGHARALLGLSGDVQRDAAVQVVENRLNVRQTEQLVKTLQRGGAKAAPVQDAAADANIQSLENDLSDKLGAAVTIQHRSSGKGKLLISYNSLDELDGILGHIQ